MPVWPSRVTSPAANRPCFASSQILRLPRHQRVSAGAGSGPYGALHVNSELAPASGKGSAGSPGSPWLWEGHSGDSKALMSGSGGAGGASAPVPGD